MNKPLEALTATLKSHGYSVTKSRKTVFMALLDREPQSIAELTKIVGDTTDRASIYRTLELFESLNIVERLPIGWKHKFELSDAFTTHHHHATCIRCVYRTLELFESLNIVERLPIGWKHKFELSDVFTTHHHHATCIRCGKITPFEESDTLRLELKKQAEAIGFIETNHQLEVRGICNQCRSSYA